MNNAGTVIMEVADLSQMLLNTRVDETSIADVQVGQKSTVRMEAYRDKTFEGTVVSVALANFDPNTARGANRMMMQNNDGTKFYKCEILLKTDGQRIFSGLTADVDIETKRWENVLKIPSQAVLGREVDNLPPDIRDRPEVDELGRSHRVVELVGPRPAHSHVVQPLVLRHGGHLSSTSPVRPATHRPARARLRHDLSPP